MLRIITITVFTKQKGPIEELTTRNLLVNPIIVFFALSHCVECRAQTRKSLEKSLCKYSGTVFVDKLSTRFSGPIGALGLK